MTTSPGFAVQLPVFTGPFRLLADLVLEQKIDVCDVPVARVTERFLAEGTRLAKGWNLEESTWFVAACAVLLELKVGRLLPRPTVDTEEDLLGGASPDLVYARSLELAAFRRAAEQVHRLMEDAALMVPRSAAPPAEFARLYPDILAGVRPLDLAALASGLLAPPPGIDLSHVTPITATVADALRVVEAHLASSPDTRFRDLVEGCTDRIDVVVRFLALLELYREGKIELSQAKLFGEIRVRWQPSASAPREEPGEGAGDEWE